MADRARRRRERWRRARRDASLGRARRARGSDARARRGSSGVTPVLLILRKDVRTLLRTPALLVVLLAYPVMIAALLGLVAGYANAKPRVALVDLDGLPAHIV